MLEATCVSSSHVIGGFWKHMWLLAMGASVTVQNLCHGLASSAMVFNYDQRH